MLRLQGNIGRGLAWFTISRVGVLMLLVAVPGNLMIYRQEHPRVIVLGELLSESDTTFTWEFVRIAFTILIIGRLYHRHEMRK